MRRLPSRFRRLDGALADLPVDEPMLLTELDGFLTGVLLSPVPIAPAEWMTPIWGWETDGIPPFEDPLDVQWFAAAVAARRDEIARDLARGKLQPILDIDERHGELLWEEWVAGFAEAVALRPDAWDALAADPATAEPWSRLQTLIGVAHGNGDLDSVEINTLHDRAVPDLTHAVQRIHDASPGAGDPRSAADSATGKIGRNDPCPCGSEKKYKRCCA